MSLFKRKEPEPSEEEKRAYLKARFEAEAEVVRELRARLRQGDVQYLRDLMTQGGAPPEVTEDDAAMDQLLYGMAWSNYWRFRYLEKAGAVSQDEVDDAWAECLSTYGDSITDTRDAAVAAARSGEDFDAAIVRLTPTKQT